ncbi:hypothetical protein LDENG_00202970 [Lucifuga dentata]|nr:hypothetical protein LDENG_00202970 [Lucifuga dentata]
MDIATVNALSYRDFLNIFGNVVEKCPSIMAAVWSSRPFANLTALEAAVSQSIDALPESGKEGILRCLSELGGRDQSVNLSPESREEQAAAGLDVLNPTEASRMDRLNLEYGSALGFRLSCAPG